MLLLLLPRAGAIFFSLCESPPLKPTACSAAAAPKSHAMLFVNEILGAFLHMFKSKLEFQLMF